MKLLEMDGFLRGKCLPGDMKVNETNAEYLVRKFTELEQKLSDSQREFRAADATIENLQMQVEKLAAENAGLKESRKNLAEFIHEELDADYPLNMDIETPATGAFLAEVRAQGVDVARNAMIDFVEGEVGPNENVPGLIRAAEICVSIAENLRKGVQS
ncbi:hypothetical protein [Enterobacter asburiae]|uniref:hypothetical protein n=1 Tax=Enterobacter asburiae TaxID=61645 RepID=UPI0021D1937E|nr:hypothetical protein [Enterobacter asburiae]MCU6241180.1 hypothetical protein [Enterobacter asburiae]